VYSRYCIKNQFTAIVLMLGGLLIGAYVRAEDFTVCIEPDNFPFSHRTGTGYENRIAAVLAEDLHAQLKLVPIANDGPGYFRATLGSGRCEALVGLPVPNNHVLTTRPYYRSGWMFVSRRAHALDIRSFDDPRLKELRIGVPVVGDGSDAPPVIALGRRRLADRLRLYAVSDDSGDEVAAHMIDDVANGRIDLALMWGPAAGYYAARRQADLRLSPTPTYDHGIPFSASIGVAVASGNATLRDALDRAIVHRRGEINAILARYRIPILAP
jgi:mxaJ protein